jgi:hypothetical protein
LPAEQVPLFLADKSPDPVVRAEVSRLLPEFTGLELLFPLPRYAARRGKDQSGPIIKHRGLR